MNRSRILRADAMLLLLAMLWGYGFIAQKWAMLNIGPLTFVTIRLLLGTLVLLPFLYLGKRAAPRVKTSSRALIPLLIGAVIAVFLGTWLQQVGLMTTEVGTASFITGLYVIFTPLLGLLVGYYVRSLTWIAIIVAVIGLFLLSVAGRPVLNIGDLLVMVCAIAWGAQLLLVGWLAPRMDVIKLSVIQLAGAGLISLILTPIFEPLSLTAILAAKWELLYSGILASGAAFILQAWAQQDAPPAHAAILISFESVFGLAFGWWLLDEELTTVQLIGCALMFAAIIVAQIRPPRQAFFDEDEDGKASLPRDEDGQRYREPA